MNVTRLKTAVLPAWEKHMVWEIAYQWRDEARKSDNPREWLDTAIHEVLNNPALLQELTLPWVPEQFRDTWNDERAQMAFRGVYWGARYMVFPEQGRDWVDGWRRYAISRYMRLHQPSDGAA